MALSPDPEAKGRQLANLRPGAGAAEPGNRRALKHGGRSERPPGLDAARADLFDWLAESAPIRADDGGLPAADSAAVELAAMALARVRALDSWLAVHGYLDEKTGAEKPAVAALERATATATKLLGKLGMTPADRASLGVAVAKGRDLAAEWAAEAEAEERDRG